MFTNMPSDVVTNTFHFDPLTPLDMAATIPLVMPGLAQFYSQVYNATYKMGNYLVPGSATVHWYDLGDPPPRSPTIVSLGATITTVATAIPTEVACVLSMQAPQVSGQPQARRRGRIYLGGVTELWMQTSTSAAFPTWSGAGVLHVTAAAAVFADAVRDNGVRWSVWSTVDAASALVTNGWVDNSPDTQRRRSVDASSRTTWVLGP